MCAVPSAFWEEAGRVIKPLVCWESRTGSSRPPLPRLAAPRDAGACPSGPAWGCRVLQGSVQTPCREVLLGVLTCAFVRELETPKRKPRASLSQRARDESRPQLAWVSPQWTTRQAFLALTWALLPSPPSGGDAFPLSGVPCF